MMLSRIELILLIITIIVVVADIILACCLRLALPFYLTQDGYYPADGREVTIEEASEHCPCLLRVAGKNPQIETVNIIYSKTHETYESRRKRSFLSTSYYPFLVSLSIPTYNDDPTEKIFACNGIIKSTEWLFTTKNCVKDDTEWLNLTVRSDSDFWSVFGLEHKVVDVVTSDFLVALKVFPKFPEKLLPKPQIQYQLESKWISAMTLGWDEDMYEKNVQFRFKYSPYHGERYFSSKLCRITATARVCYGMSNRKLSSKFLMTFSHQIIGVKIKEERDRQFLSLRNFTEQTLEYNDCYEIYDNICI